MQAVIFVGIQGSGKSSFYRERFFETHVRINLDMLKTRYRERLLLDACIAAKQPFVVDNTNVRAAERATYVVPARAAGFRIIGYYFRSDLRAALWRNKQRENVVPVPGVIGTWKRLQPPSPDDGFDEIWSVDLTEAGEFLVEPFVPLDSVRLKPATQHLPE